MSEKPSSVTITCQSCKKCYSPKNILLCRGQCTSCTTAQWQLHAEFDILRNGSTSPLSSDGALLTNIGLNAIGIGLLVATGSGFTVRVGGGGDGSDKPTGGKSVADIYDVPGQKVFELCNPPRQALNQLGDFILQKEAEIQRERMKERGGSRCRACQILFVPSSSKPWTLVGSCSKSCCASLHGVADYSLIENAVNESTMEATTKVEQTVQEQAYVQAACSCGHLFQLSKMYRGTYRKCPNCQAKVLVPLNG